jgi:hypothetical protein
METTEKHRECCRRWRQNNREKYVAGQKVWLQNHKEQQKLYKAEAYRRNPLPARYRSMVARCYDPRNSNYHRYGGRGIKVCERWLASMQHFINDMRLPPKGMTLDRINNDGNYEPGNCRWATLSQQALNRG